MEKSPLSSPLAHATDHADGIGTHPLAQQTPPARSFNPPPFQLMAAEEDEAALEQVMEGEGIKDIVFDDGTDGAEGEDVDSKPENAQDPNAEPMQLKIKNLTMDKKTGTIKSVITDGKRPKGQVTGKQGDHSTPFVVLQHQLVNALTGCTLEEGWANLAATFEVYKSLPGWASTKKFVTGKGGAYIESMLKTKGGKPNLLLTAKMMLEVRNQLDLTAYPSTKTKGKNHNEQGEAGGLHYLETRLRNHRGVSASKEDCLLNIYRCFDHGRFDKLTSSTRKKKIIRQHAITMQDAYPMLSEHFSITVDDIEQKFYDEKDIE